MNWDLFFKKNERKSFIIALNYIKNREDAFEVIQETMFSMYKNYRHIKEEKEARAIFYKILNNKLTDKYRTIKRWLNNFGDNEYIEESLESEEKKETDLSFIMKGMDKLTSIQKRVLLLKSIEEFTFKEIANLLSVSESTCKTHYARAIKKIKDNVD